MQPSTSTSSVKLCIDCANMASSSQGWENFKCLAPENKISEETNLVTGQITILWNYKSAINCRSGALETACGKEAKWFKQREAVTVSVNNVNDSVKEKETRMKLPTKISADMI